MVNREAALKSAEKLIRQGKLDAAIAEYVRLTADQPRDWTALNALGDLYLRSGQPDRAVAQFTKVAEHLVHDQANARAAAVFRKILRINPSDARAKRGLAALEARYADKELTRRGVPAAAADDPDGKVRAARAALDIEDVDLACTLLLEAASLYEGRARPWDALAAVAEASAADPSNLVLREQLLTILVGQGEIVQARYVARGVRELLMVAEAFERKERASEALDIKVEAAAFDPADAALRERVLRELVAVEDFERPRRLARSSADLLIVAGALTRLGRSAEVLEVTAEAVKRDPGNVALREHFVDASIGTGDVDRAAQAARSTRDWLAVAAARRQQNRHAEALDAMGQALRREPENVALHADFVRECLLAGDTAQAVKAARTTAERLLVADAVEQAGDAAGALEARADAAQRDPDAADLWARVARDSALAGNLARTIRLARTVPELLSLADLVAAQGRGADSRELLTEAARRSPENTELRLRLAQEYHAAGEADRARLVLQNPTELVQLAERLGGGRDALRLLDEASRLDSENVELRQRVAREWVHAGDTGRARTVARTTADLFAIAAQLAGEGRAAEALDVKVEAAERDPADLALRAQVGRDCAAAGDLVRARIFLTPATAGRDPDLLVALARLDLGADRLEAGRQALARLLEVRADRRGEVLRLAGELAGEGHMPSAYACAELCADAALAEQDWSAAAGALQEFTRMSPGHIPALTRLVEVCVDGNLTDAMDGAQAALADACIVAGQGSEARIIAEDLVMRRPWVAGAMDRLRRALALTGESDPDHAIAELLSGESPFTFEDL